MWRLEDEILELAMKASYFLKCLHRNEGKLFSEMSALCIMSFHLLAGLLLDIESQCGLK